MKYLWLLALISTSSFAAEWKSKSTELSLVYDDAEWNKISEFDHSGESSIGLLSSSGARSIVFQVESGEDLLGLREGEIEKNIIANFQQMDPTLEVLKKKKRKYSNTKFRTLLLKINNPEAGQQYLLVLFNRKNQNALTVMASWPIYVAQEGHIPSSIEAVLSKVSW